MIQVILTFLFSCCISFAGSLQPGPVNLGVAHTALSKGYRPALWLALGGSLPELLYAGLAAPLSVQAVRHFAGNTWFRWTVALVFILSGISMLLNRPTGKKASANRSGSLAQGLLLALFNLMLLPFWVGVSGFLQNYPWFEAESITGIAAFVTGAFTGALLLNCLLAYLIARRQAQPHPLRITAISRALGIICIGLGIFQAFYRP